MSKSRWIGTVVLAASAGLVIGGSGCESRREQQLENRAERIEDRAEQQPIGRYQQQALERRADNLEQRADEIPNVMPGTPAAAPVLPAQPPEARGGGPATRPQAPAPQSAQHVQPEVRDARAQLQALRQSNQQLDHFLRTAQRDLAPIYRRNADALAQAMQGDFAELRARLPRIRAAIQNTELWSRYGDEMTNVARAVEQGQVEAADIHGALQRHNVDPAQVGLNVTDIARLLTIAETGLQRLDAELQRAAPPQQGAPSAAGGGPAR